MTSIQSYISEKNLSFKRSQLTMNSRYGINEQCALVPRNGGRWCIRNQQSRQFISICENGEIQVVSNPDRKCEFYLKEVANAVVIQSATYQDYFLSNNTNDTVCFSKNKDVRAYWVFPCMISVPVNVPKDLQFIQQFEQLV